MKRKGKSRTRISMHIRKNTKAAPDLDKIYARLKDTEGKLAEAEKFRSISQLASGMAHEIRNPLAILVQCLEFLEIKVPSTDVDARQTLAVMKNNIARANKIISVLYNFSDSGEPNLNAEDVNAILEESVSVVMKELNPANIEIVRQVKSDIPMISADKPKIAQVFINVISNSINAMPEGGKLTVRTYEKMQKKEKGFRVGSRKDDLFGDGERSVIVEIEDTGVGIPEENLKKVSSPFFTTYETKKAGKGPGLGLPLSKSIIDLHRGMLDISSKPGEGTKITITLHVAA